MQYSYLHFKAFMHAVAKPLWRLTSLDAPLRPSMLKHLLHLVTASLLLMPTACYGLQVTLTPVQTNTIQQTAPSVTSTALIIRTPASSCASTGQSDANIRFSLTGQLPAGSTINFATLRLRANLVSDAAVYRAASSWGSSPTWNSVASTGGAPTSGVARDATPTAVGQIVPVTVTNDVAAWWSGTTNDGFVIKGSALNCQDAAFSTNPSLTNLLVDYTPPPPPAPRVIAVRVQNGGVHANYSIPSGSGEQLRTVPVGRVSQIAVVFDRDVSGANLAASWSLSNVITGSPVAVPFSVTYDSGTFTALLTVTTPNDSPAKLLLTGVSGASAIRNTSGVALDGEWVNPSSLSQGSSGLSLFPAAGGVGSGNGTAGGNFVFRIVVLPGDYNRGNSVDGADFLIYQQNVGITSGATFAQGDANGDGAVNSADNTIWSSNNGQNLTNW